MRKEDANVNFVELEKRMLETWKKNDYFKKLVEQNKNGKRFRFLDGPMTANNRAGVHHIWGRTLKDMTIKYHSMKGESQQYQNGFDAQGLWVEVNVEKELGLNGKPEILKYGLDKFTKKCMERVDYFANEITNQSIRMGQWMDWENSYFTNTDHNITSIWHFLKTCHEKGWIEKKNRPMVWCPRCGTSLSEHEMTNSYSEVEHTAIYIKLPVIGTDFRMVAWTTTPWTLSANVALAVNPDMDYSLVRMLSTGEKLVMGATAVKRVLKGDAEILDTFKGSKLVGLTYETCFPELEEEKFEHKIVPWEDVAEEDGSGVVHIAPGCGAEDFELGKRHGLPEICPIDEQGVMLGNTGFLAGKKTTDVVELVVNRLKNDNKLLYSHKHKHSYAHCWRCKTDIVYKLVGTWYIKMDEIKPLALKAIEDVEFKPAYAKKRMEDWLNNMGDWNISRSRFYGLPLPFYICSKCGKLHVVGSIDELKKKAVDPKKVDALPNLHRPWIDEIQIKCECGEVLNRIPEVGDCWLDAGITPFSTKKYFTDKKYFNDNFPSDYVCEMIEQIKLWFYSLLIMSVVLTGKAPYKRIVTHQYVKDEHGNEFHKSGGNSLDADKVADEVSADAIRYLYGSANTNNEMRFGYNLCDEARRKIMAYWNIYTFLVTYAVIDNPDIAGYKPNFKNMNVTDKWLIEKINNFAVESDKAYADNRQYDVARSFEILVDDISNFYIRANRKRFWKSKTGDQMDAYWCLYHAVKVMTQVVAPIIPFITDHIWHNLVVSVEKNEAPSVHLSRFPGKIANVDFSDVMAQADKAREVIYLAQKLRNEYNIKVKQPLQALYLQGNDEYKKAVAVFESLVKEELNVKEIVFEKDENRFNDVAIKLNFRTAGAVLKGDVNKVKNYLEGLSNEEHAKLSEQMKSGSVKVGEFGTLPSDLFVVSLVPKKEFAVSNIGNTLVALDTTITEELLLEGVARELTRGVQVARKEADFDLTDRIVLDFSGSDDKILRLVEAIKEKLMSETLAVKVEKISAPTIEKTFDLAIGKVVVKIKKA